MIQLICSVVVALVILIISLEYAFRFGSQYKAFVKLNGPKLYLPLIGNTFEILRFSAESGFRITRENAQRYKNGYAYYGLGKLYLKIYTAENFQKICNLNNTKKNFFYTFMTAFLSKGLLNSFGPKWLRRRKIITPTFHFNILKQFQNVISAESGKLVNALYKNVGQITDITDVVPKLTLNIICETAMGIKIDELGVANAHKYQANVHKVGDFMQHRIFSPHLYYDFTWWLSGKQYQLSKILTEVHEFTRKIIDKRRLTFVGGTQDVDHENVYLNKKTRFALLDTLLEAQRNGNQIDDAGIQEEVDTFVFTGYDTVSMAIVNALMMVANEPEHQQRLYEEITQAIENNNNEPLQIPHYAELDFLDRFLKEVLRLYPSAALLGRELMEELEINGVMLPAGSSVHLMIYDLHRDPEQFPDPLRFDPDRFLPEQVKNRHPFAYLPFSAGPRNCIGQRFAVLQIKTVLSNIITNFVLEPITRPKDLVFIADMILHTNHPIKVKFVPRSNVIEMTHL